MNRYVYSKELKKSNIGDYYLYMSNDCVYVIRLSDVLKCNIFDVITAFNLSDISENGEGFLGKLEHIPDRIILSRNTKLCMTDPREVKEYLNEDNVHNTVELLYSCLQFFMDMKYKK